MKTTRFPHPEKENPSLAVIYCGGTISSIVNARGSRAGGTKLNLLELLAQARPEDQIEADIISTAYAYTGLSENMSLGYWRNILTNVENALMESPRGILLTHGTDSLEQTARFLQEQLGERLILAGTSIIMTGANHDISSPTTDAWDNLHFALECTQKELPPAVYVAFHGRLIPASQVVKEPYFGGQMHFASLDSAEYLNLVDRKLAEDNELVRRLAETFSEIEPDHHTVVSYPVNVVRAAHADFESSLTPEVKAVVLTLYHSGTANTEDPEASVALLAERLASKGIVVFAVTENGEPVNFNAYETAQSLSDAGVIPLGGISARVAVEKLSYLTALDRERMIEAMCTDMVGEF